MWQHWIFHLLWNPYILKSRVKELCVPKWLLIFENWLIGLGTHVISVFFLKKNAIFLFWKSLLLPMRTVWAALFSYSRAHTLRSALTDLRPAGAEFFRPSDVHLKTYIWDRCDAIIDLLGLRTLGLFLPYNGLSRTVYQLWVITIYE